MASPGSGAELGASAARASEFDGIPATAVAAGASGELPLEPAISGNCHAAKQLSA
jgi:hypothetical protein